MALMDSITAKYGPLTAWQWGLAAAGIGYLVLRKGKSTPTPAPDATTPAGASGPAGEFSSSQSTSQVDPVTGKTVSSSYDASGPLAGGWGGGVGIPAAYPMPYSGGDVYVNLPGDTQNAAPGRPASFPPATGPGVSPGHAGGFWWRPMNAADVAGLSAVPYGFDFTKLSPDAQNAVRISMNYTRIVDANPQINWAGIRDLNDIIGKALYIPQGSTGSATQVGFMPPNATLNAPQGYTPPAQQTGVSGTS
jgi:hypothetical protein